MSVARHRIFSGAPTEYIDYISIPESELEKVLRALLEEWSKSDTMETQGTYQARRLTEAAH